MRSARELIAAATAQLATAGVGSPRVDAELLLASLLGVPRAVAALRADVPGPVPDEYARLVARRAAREPLQHILGTAPFRHLELAVGPGVFVPRPETELLVDAVLAHLRTLTAPLVVDLCAGSGALGLAVADEVPAARVVAVEASAAARDWLARNAAGTAVEVVAADVRDPELLAAERGRVDAVLCNPPYVPVSTAVEPEVRADPAEAVFAGPHGLDLVPTVIRQASRLLAPGGVFAMEHDETQAEAVRQLLLASGCWNAIVGHRDLTGRPRFVTARRGGNAATAC